VTAVDSGVTFDRSYPGCPIDKRTNHLTGHVVAVLLTFAIHHNHLYFLPFLFSLESSYIESIYALAAMLPVPIVTPIKSIVYKIRYIDALKSQKGTNPKRWVVTLVYLIKYKSVRKV
jgi:hypothetical protein